MSEDEEFECFKPSLFEFLEELKENNDRDWFAQNKGRYESLVREPALAFVRAIRPMLWSISPHFRAEDRKQGGALMRVYRDVRFSKDKSPYKTNVGIHFRHKAGKDAHAPGFYFHMESGSVFVGAGSWAPPSDALRSIREHIEAEPEAWKGVIGAKAFAQTFELGGESLKRPPRGFDKDHPLIEDIKRKSFIATLNLTQRSVLEPGLPERVAEYFEGASGLVGFICEALDVEF